MTHARLSRRSGLVAGVVALTILLSGCIGSVASPPPPMDPSTVLTPAEAAGIEAVAAIDPTAVATVVGGWPYVRFADVEAFARDFVAISQIELFRSGGTYSLGESDHLRIVHIPTRTSDHAIDTVIGIAIDHPDAEVLLQAPTAGPQWPTLYVARLTPEQVVEVEARLRDPALADADVEGYPVDFVLTSVGADGPVYTTGTFGDVPAGSR